MPQACPCCPCRSFPSGHQAGRNEGPVTFTAGHHFTAAGGDDPRELAEAATAPLSVIVQVTKRCDFGCVFCSETLMMPDPTLDQLDVIRANLAGVQRVFLSGGEPLLRRDLPEIVDMYSGFILGLPTNATRGVAMAPRLAGKVAFVNIGFDGPRATFSQVRGDYDKAMTGVRAFIDAGLPVSLSAVVLRSTVHALPYLYQIADVLDCGKLKLILPLRKGNALGLAEREFITVDEARDAFGRLTELRALHDWRPAVRMTPWTRGDRRAHDRGRAVRGRPGLAGLRPARPVPQARQPAARSRSPGSGTATPTSATTSPSTSAPASTPPPAAARDAHLHEHGLAG